MTERIRSEVNDGMEKTQREFLLRQQLAAIRKELGEDGGAESTDDYRTRVAEAGLPEKVREAAEREVDKLERTSEQSPEHGWIRTWLDTLLEVPWGTRSEDRLDIPRRAASSTRTTPASSDVKDRIVEYLAVRKLRAEREPPAGEAADRAERARPARRGRDRGARRPARRRQDVAGGVGGTRPRPQVRAHRAGWRARRSRDPWAPAHLRRRPPRSPGRARSHEAGTMNPVVLLDEVDKLGADWRGDPSSALLEVLDPAQNHTFRDHYLEVDLDLSDVLFLATANVAETIPGPLLDRMELVRLDGYTEDEKVGIARDHLLVAAA